MKTKEERLAKYYERNAEIKAKRDERLRVIREKDAARMAEIAERHPVSRGTPRPSMGARLRYRYMVGASVENLSHGMGGLMFTAWDGLPECVEVWGRTYWKP